MPLPENFTTSLIVKETKVIHSGQTRTGGQYKIWQVIATKPDGTPIDQFNLRSFADLPKNEVIEVEAELYRSEQYGDSYTLKQKGGQRSSGLGKQVDELRERVERIEQLMGISSTGEPVQQEPSPPPAPSPAPPPTPAAPPPQAVPSGGLPSDDDVPF